MPLSADIDNLVRQRFAELESEAKRLVVWMNASYPITGSDGSTYSSNYHQLLTNFLSLIQMLATKRNSFSELIKDARAANELSPAKLHGMIAGLKNDYESGMLRSIAEMTEKNVVGDYLTQAEQLLKGSKDGVHTYGPAAVLAGAVLEDGLRRLCNRQTPPISTNKSGGHPKTMGTLIEELKTQELYSELKAKQLRAWADIRNAAAHGRFNDFSRSDVEQMILGISTFLDEHLRS
jgi:hypothetical protein